MPAPQQFPRDDRTRTARMLLKDVTDKVFAFLEALATGEVVITPNGRAKGRILATLKKWVLHIDLTVPTFTVTVAGTETVPNGGFYRTFEIPNTGLPDGTPVAVDYSLQGYPVMFVGASVNGGTIFLDFWHAEGNVTPPFTMAAGTITVRPIL